MRSLVRLLLRVFPCSIAMLAVACGSSDAPSEAPDSSADAGTDGANDTRDAATDTKKEYVPRAPRCAPSDAGVPDAQIPDAFDDAFDAPLPDAADPDSSVSDGGAPIVTTPVQVVSSGGRVLRSPRVVPITFEGNTNRNEIEDFCASFGCTSYWRAIANEYGVYDAVTGTPIRIAEPAPAEINDRAIMNWLKKNIEAKTPGWDLPTPDTLYAIYYPSSTTVTLGTDSTSCVDFGGFHENLVLSDGTTVPFAVMMDCDDDLDEVTSVSSHEFIEAATDPFPLYKPAYQFTDSDHIVYSLRAGGEVADLCSEPGDSLFPTDYPFMVQRSWSNLASRAGHDPCVPAPPDVYFNTVPELPDPVGTAFPGLVTKGVKIPIGGERTIYLQLFADGAIAPWTISVKDSSGEAAHLSFTLEKTTGKAGDRIALTISKKSESSRYGFEPFAITSTDGKHRHVSYGVVGH